ncbi:DUF2997 domain-containing protein [Dactylosporangium vinaceum]|uniref:DUF2997 domain-containing protein n=1 Tax=Dactylosporangium vinaceum TaxID=53362 RepID=A0ABV5MH73_9ACTN|nr:DUF2997 domain-containing protein [Dactylosporangium vinaceum]UAB94870.1 DUF2997 domain-containing protein [Dactylosporangium vinaceum]
MQRIVVTVAEDGTVAAETLGVTGSKCLDYVALLEDLLAAQTVHSEYTREFQGLQAVTRQEQHDGY